MAEVSQAGRSRVASQSHQLPRQNSKPGSFLPNEGMRQGPLLWLFGLLVCHKVHILVHLALEYTPLDKKPNTFSRNVYICLLLAFIYSACLPIYLL